MSTDKTIEEAKKSLTEKAMAHPITESACTKEHKNMLDNYRKIYNEELNRFKEDGSHIAWELLNLTQTRAFVYEICKRVVREADDKIVPGKKRSKI